MRRIFVLIILCLQFHTVSSQIEKLSERTLDSLALVLSTSEGEDRLLALHSLGKYYYFTDSVSLSYDYLLQSIELATELENKRILNDAYNLIGYIQLYWGDFAQSLETFMEAHKIGQEMENRNVLLISLHGMSRAYTDLNKLDKALEITFEGLKLSIEWERKKEEGGFYNNLSSIYIAQQKYDSALYCLKNYYRISDELDDARSKVYALNNMGEVYILMEDFNSALIHLNRALEENKEQNDAMAKSATYGNIGQIHWIRKEYGMAIEYLHKSLAISRAQGISKFTISNYSWLSRAYEELGDHENALKYLNLHINLKDSIYNLEKDKLIHDLEFKFESEENMRKLQLLEQKAKNQRLWLFLTISLTVLAISLMIMFVQAYRNRVRRHSLEKKEMEETIDEQNRAITSSLFSSSQQRKHLNEAIDTIKNLSSRKSQKDDLEDELVKINDLLRSGLSVEDEWETIKLHFDKVHPDFFKKLQDDFDGLTQYDLKLLSYIKMNLSTKEIARILHISDRAVQTARYRIKKKMDLPGEVDLISFIQKM